MTTMGFSYYLKDMLYEDIFSYLHTATSARGDAVLVWQYKREFLNSDLIRQLTDMADLVMRVRHPHVLTMIDFYSDGQEFFTVHEPMAEATVLELFLDEQRDDTALLWRVSTQISSAMVALESYDLLWGGINFHHVLITADGHAKLTKIGLPLLLFRYHLDRLDVLDHAAFLPPEFVINRLYDVRGDVYAFGVLLYRFFSGKWPYGSSEFRSDLRRQFQGPMRQFRRRSERLPARLDALILTCVQQRPEDRFSSFSDLIQRYEHGPLPTTFRTPMRSTLLDQGVQFFGDFWRLLVAQKLKIGMFFGSILLVIFLLFAWQRHLDTERRPLETVPAVVGKTVAVAMAELAKGDLEVVIGGYRFDDKVPSGCVVETKPPVGREVRSGREVKLYISKGPSSFRVPTLVGHLLTDLGRILPAGATVNVVSEVYSYSLAKGHIISQSPSPNAVGRDPIQLVVSGGYPVTLSYDRFPNGTATVTVYVAVLKTGESQAIVVRDVDADGTSRVLYQETQGPGFQDTLSFQVKLGDEIQIFYNQKKVLNERLE